MKTNEALKIINSKGTPKGYMVSFEVREGSVLRSDHFPDKHAGEPLIPTEHDAWELAKQFADATGDDTYNIYVIDHTFSPVRGYAEKKLKPYSPQFYY